MARDTVNSDEISGRLAVTLLWSQRQGQIDTITEADVIFNPNPSDPWSIREGKDALNFFDVAVHEFGHMPGMHHAISRAARMFFQGGAFGYGLNQLSWDDVAGINVLFPLPGIDRLTGSIGGRVTRAGQGIFGAFVVAVDTHGVVTASGITLPGGHYEILNLPPGDYTVYAEPLDGPTRPSNISGGVFSISSLDGNFPPTFLENSQEARVRVNVGNRTRGIDIRVAGGQTGLDPEFVGAAPDPSGAIRVATTATRAHLGTNTNIMVAGKGVGSLNDSNGVHVLGQRIIAGHISATRTHPSGIIFKFFPITVPSNAPSGQYSLVLEGPGERGIITGGLEIFSPFRFQQAFGQFAHLPGTISSRLWVVNTNLDDPVETSIEIRANNGQIAGSDFGIVSADGEPSRSASLRPGGSSTFRTVGSMGITGSVRTRADSWPTVAAILIDSEFGTTGLGPGHPVHGFLAPVDLKDRGISMNTGIAISNVDEREAHVLLRLHDSEGAFRGEHSLVLPGGGQTAKFVDQMVPVPYDSNGGFHGTITVTSNRLVTGAVIRTQPRVFTTFPVLLNEVATRRVFAQFGHGRRLNSELILANPSATATATQVRVRVRNSAGRMAAVTINGVNYPNGELQLTIPPRGVRSLKTTQQDFVGWVEVDSAIPVGETVLFSSEDLGTAGVGQSELSSRLVAPLERNISQQMDMGVAIVNAQADSNSVTLVARDRLGNQVGRTVTLHLTGFQHIARFVNESDFDLELPDTFSGSLWMESTLPIAATAIRQSPGVLTTFPVTDRNLFLIPALESIQ